MNQMIRSNFPSQLAGLMLPLLERDMEHFIPGIQAYCESPIEAMLGTAIFYLHRIILRATPIYILTITPPEITGPLTHQSPSYLVPQAPFEQYRIDWILHFGTAKVLIECDGHDFHERTKEQAAHDRRKDRAIQLRGLPILRFTGSEIHRDPLSCAVQVLLLALDRSEAPN